MAKEFKGIVFIDLTRPSSIMSNISYKAERVFRAFTDSSPDRKAFVSLDIVRKMDKELADKLEDQLLS